MSRYFFSARSFWNMKILLITMLTIAIASGDSRQRDNALYFVSLNHSIQEGQYDGVATVASLRSHGDFGLGSEDKLSGELVLLDGEFYSIPENGKATRMKDTDSIAFAAVKFFIKDSTFTVNSIGSLKNLEDELKKNIHPNSFAAIRIHGKFETITLRSFHTQHKPYRPVNELPQVKFDRQNLEGTMVGYFTPASAEVINSPPYHFHFIDDGRTTGGHVLDCVVLSGTVEVNYASELRILLPQKSATEHIDLNKPIAGSGN